MEPAGTPGGFLLLAQRASATSQPIGSAPPAYNSAMPEPNSPTSEPDDRLPSGPWEGYFLDRRVSATKGQMELDLTFRDGRIAGAGRDGIGPFTIAGRYDTADGVCHWTKNYRTHSVRYRGFAEAKGIWGTWEIPPLYRDGFHIWPKGRGGDQQAQRREETPPLTFEDEALNLEPAAINFQ
jgi:hypothetical protein